jgi:hypothetical protein
VAVRRVSGPAPDKSRAKPGIDGGSWCGGEVFGAPSGLVVNFRPETTICVGKWSKVWPWRPESASGSFLRPPWSDSEHIGKGSVPDSRPNPQDPAGHPPMGPLVPVWVPGSSHGPDRHHQTEHSTIPPSAPPLGYRPPFPPPELQENRLTGQVFRSLERKPYGAGRIRRVTGLR